MRRTTRASGRTSNCWYRSALEAAGKAYYEYRAVLDACGWSDISTACDLLLDYEIDEAAWGRKKNPYSPRTRLKRRNRGSR